MFKTADPKKAFLASVSMFTVLFALGVLLSGRADSLAAWVAAAVLVLVLSGTLYLIFNMAALDDHEEGSLRAEYFRCMLVILFSCVGIVTIIGVAALIIFSNNSLSWGVWFAFGNLLVLQIVLLRDRLQKLHKVRLLMLTTKKAS